MFKKKTKPASKPDAKPEAKPNSQHTVNLKSLLKSNSDAQRRTYEQSIETIANRELNRIKKEISEQIKDWVHRPDETSLFSYRYIYIGSLYDPKSHLDGLALGDLLKSLSSKVDAWLLEEEIGQAKWDLGTYLTADIEILWPPTVPAPPAYSA